jgi:peptide/nickel transport system permease protein
MSLDRTIVAASETAAPGWRSRVRVGERFGVLRGIPKIPFAILLAFLFLGFFGSWVAPHDPVKQSLVNRLQPPVWEEGGSWTYVLGTDGLGRDVLSRVIVGARSSMWIGLTTVFIAGLIGTMVGVLSGYFRGAVDYILMRLTDAMMAIPFLVVALALAVVFNPSMTLLISILVAFGWAGYARVIRSVTLQLRNADFVTLAHVGGCSHWRTIRRHILPNVANTFVVLATLQLATIIVAEASLSFLGVGVPPPTPSWGSMLSDGRQYVSSAWWISVPPGVCITVVVLSVNVLGDWLRVRLDPRFREL